MELLGMRTEYAPFSTRLLETAISSRQVEIIQRFGSANVGMELCQLNNSKLFLNFPVLELFADARKMRLVPGCIRHRTWDQYIFR
jgi:hypothetical protein